LTSGGGQGTKAGNNNKQLYPGDIRVGSGLHATRGYKQPSSAINSEFASPRGSPKAPGSTFNEDIRSNKQGDMHFLTDKLRADVQNLKKKSEFLQTLFNKQTDYFDDHMYKMSVQFDNITNLEKRLNLYIGQLDLVP
jgi:hypothetical protein